MGLKSIFREGMKERRRKKSLRKSKNELKEKERIHDQQLTALGQKAWESKINIVAYADLQARLTAAQKQFDDLQAQAEKLQEQKQAEEEERKRENERFAARQKEVEAKKKIVDGNLQEQNNALNAIQKEVEQGSSRLKAIASERAQLEIKIAATTTPDTEKIAGQNKLTGLAKEVGELKTKVREKEEAGKVGSAKITPLQEESDRLQKQIDSINAEQKQVVGDWDKKISALNLEMTGSNNKIKETEKTQGTNYKQLGEKLAASGAGNEKINPELAAVKSTQTEMENVIQGIGNLERQKDDAAVSAYKKMVTIIIAGAVMIAAIIILLFILLSPFDSF
jgi:chromosome segregation ATPase